MGGTTLRELQKQQQQWLHVCVRERERWREKEQEKKKTAPKFNANCINMSPEKRFFTMKYRFYAFKITICMV